MKKRYKILRSASWLRAEFVLSQKNISLFREKLKDMDYIEIPPVFYRDGWYYDRIKRQSWHECHGLAFLCPDNHFLYCLRVTQHINEFNLTKDVIHAIRTLIFFNLATKGQRELLRFDSEVKQIIRFNRSRLKLDKACTQRFQLFKQNILKRKKRQLKE